MLTSMIRTPIMVAVRLPDGGARRADGGREKGCGPRRTRAVDALPDGSDVTMFSRESSCR